MKKWLLKINMDFPDLISLIDTDSDNDGYDDYNIPNTSRTDETSFTVPRSTE